MEKQSKVAIVCCSNGQHLRYKEKINILEKTLLQIGLIPIFSDQIFEKYSVFNGTEKERAESLMDYYRDDEIKAIFDISGGDIANEILPYLDFELISQANKSFWGYSDLTTIINAIYAKTGKTSVLYQVRNLIYSDSENQISNFTNTIFSDRNDLFSFDYELLQKDSIHGIVVGGNIRCLLKLAGTQYWPNMAGKVLLLESYSGVVPQMVTYLNQLKQMDVFGQINGIILGTFTNMEEEACNPNIIDLVKLYAGDNIPIAITNEIGHGVNSKGVVIGKEIYLSK
ncbi:S66 family peptidase [Anaerosporobacter sp.]